MLDPATHRRRLYAAARSRPARALRRLHTEGDLAFDAEHVGVLARFQPRRALRPAQGRRSARGDGLDPPVPTRLGRAGADRRDAPGRHPICQRSWSARKPARRARSTRRAGYSTGEGFRLEGALGASQPVPARRRAAHRRHRRAPQEQNRSIRFRRTTGASATAPSAPARSGARDYQAFRAIPPALYGLHLAANSTPIWQKRWTYAYGAEILATNESRLRHFAAVSLGDAYFIGGLIGQVGYRPLEQPARSDQGLPPDRAASIPKARCGNGADFYLRNRIDGSAYYPVGDSFVLAGRVARRLDLRHPRATSSRRRGGSMRAAAARCAASAIRSSGPRDPNNDPARRPQPHRIRARGPLPLRQLRRRRLRRRRPGL